MSFHYPIVSRSRQAPGDLNIFPPPGSNGRRMPLDFPRAPIVNGEPYNAKNRKDPKEKAARSDINAGKRSSSLFGPRKRTRLR